MQKHAVCLSMLTVLRVCCWIIDLALYHYMQYSCFVSKCWCSKMALMTENCSGVGCLVEWSLLHLVGVVTQHFSIEKICFRQSKLFGAQLFARSECFYAVLQIFPIGISGYAIVKCVM